MGKSSGWIYEGHAPLMAKRQGRRGEKRRRIVGGAVILALTVAVFAFNTATGRVTYTGNTYNCPSPNFVCVWDGA